jgi:coenzyme F420-reducing hydrogenase delta subunit
MKHICYISVIILFCAGIARAEINFGKTKMVGDTTIQPSKELIEKALIELRDSIDNSILTLQKKGETHRANYKNNIEKAYDELTSQRREIEKVIEEVVISNERTWDQNIRTRALDQIAQRRKEYHQILTNIKEATGTKP